MLLRVHTKQVFVDGRPWLDHLPALFHEGRGHGLQHGGALRPLGVTGRRHVIDESLRADKGQGHPNRLIHCSRPKAGRAFDPAE